MRLRVHSLACGGINPTLIVGLLVLLPASQLLAQTHQLENASTALLATTTSVTSDSVATLWTEHRNYVLAAVAVCLAQFVLIGSLLFLRERRTRAELALRRSEARSSAILRMVPDLMFVMSTEGVYLDYHARDPRDLFVAPEKFLGKHIRDIFSKDLAPIFEAKLREAATSNQPVVVEYSLQMASGERHFETRLVRCDNDTVISVVRDVTARRQSDEQLHKAHTELAQATRLRALGEMAAGIAHEVSQPISAVITNARACLRQMDRKPEDLGVVREALQDIVSDGKRAGDVITRIRSMVKQTPLRRAPISINVVVDDVIVLCRRLLRERHVRLHVALTPELPEVVGDRIQLQQILLNLVLNAADSMHNNNGRPRILAIRSNRCDGGVAVSVADSGGGLSGENLPRVFSPFFTTKIEGMGMGLSISRSIAEAHGGRLSLTRNST